MTTAPCDILVAVAQGRDLLPGAVSFEWAANLAYLGAAMLLIFAAGDLARPTTAPRGYRLLALGGLLAVFTTLYASSMLAPIAFCVAVALGAASASWVASKTTTAALSGRLALLTALGGMAATVVAGAALVEFHDPALDFVVAVAFAGAIGPAAFAGGLVRSLAQGRAAPSITVGASGLALTAVALILVVGLSVWLIQLTRHADVSAYAAAYVGLSVAAAALGALVAFRKSELPDENVMALSIAGVGLAAAATGFVLDNTALIIIGAVVGASALALARRLTIENRPRPG
jgi:NAD(P) transhydrogenase subunit beta